MRSEIDEQAAAGGNFPPRTPHNCALRIISKDHAGPERPLGSIVGGLDIAALHENEQLVASIDDDGVSQMAALGVGRLELEQTVELAL